MNIKDLWYNISFYLQVVPADNADILEEFDIYKDELMIPYELLN